MSFNFKSQPLRIRTETITSKKTSASRTTPVPIPQRLNSQKARPSNGPAQKKSMNLEPRKQNKTSAKRTPEVDFGNDESDAEVSPTIPKKKRKQEEDYEPDLKRQIRSRKAFSEDDSGVFPMVHAASIPSLDKNTKYIPLLAGTSESTEISLQYPSASQQEK